MSGTSAGFSLKYQKRMGARAMGAWGAWVTGAFIFQTESGRGSTHLPAFSLTYTPTILAEVRKNCWYKKILVKVASLVYTNSSWWYQLISLPGLSQLVPGLQQQSRRSANVNEGEKQSYTCRGLPGYYGQPIICSTTASSLQSFSSRTQRENHWRRSRQSMRTW